MIDPDRTDYEDPGRVGWDLSLLPLRSSNALTGPCGEDELWPRTVNSPVFEDCRDHANRPFALAHIPETLYKKQERARNLHTDEHMHKVVVESVK